MSQVIDPRPVCQHYGEPYRPLQITPLGGAGGFSGALLWRLTAPAGELCLRRWPPEHPSPERLRWLHAVLFYAADQGCGLLPTPIRARNGDSAIDFAGHHWELTRWMPGMADFHTSPSPDRLLAAITALGQVHAALARFPRVEAAFQPSQFSAPALDRRLQQIQHFANGGCASILNALKQHPSNDLRQVGNRLLEGFHRKAESIRQELMQAADQPYQLQLCLRDIWHDHVLFTGSQVTGIIDVASMNQDCVATDLARLLGSLIPDDGGAWEQTLAHYATIRPLTPADRQAAVVIDRANVLMAGLVWLDWICCQSRVFPDFEAVLQRLNAWDTRLTRLLDATNPPV